MAKLLLLFIAVPLIELAILLVIGDLTHWWVSLALVIVSGVVGSVLVRWQGIRTLRRIQSELAAGRQPADSLMDAAMILFAGALLLTPGVLTDAFGLTLLAPVCRRFYKRVLVSRIKRSSNFHVFTDMQSDAKGRSQIIDSYVIDPKQDSEPTESDD